MLLMESLTHKGVKTQCAMQQAMPGTTGGGAVYVTGAGTGFAKFLGCTFTQNVADSGGAIFISTNLLALQNCFFDGNAAVQNGAGRGGAVMSKFT